MEPEGVTPQISQVVQGKPRSNLDEMVGCGHPAPLLLGPGRDPGLHAQSGGCAPTAQGCGPLGGCPSGLVLGAALSSATGR